MEEKNFKRIFEETTRHGVNLLGTGACATQGGNDVYIARVNGSGCFGCDGFDSLVDLIKNAEENGSVIDIPSLDPVQQVLDLRGKSIYLLDSSGPGIDMEEGLARARQGECTNIDVPWEGCRAVYRAIVIMKEIYKPKEIIYVRGALYRDSPEIGKI